jgi:hypothetical protein
MLSWYFTIRNQGNDTKNQTSANRNGTIDIKFRIRRYTTFTTGEHNIVYIYLFFSSHPEYILRTELTLIEFTHKLFKYFANVAYHCCNNFQIPVNGGMNIQNIPKVGNRDRELTRIGSAESERESLLHTEATPQFTKHKQLYACMNEHGRTHCAGGGIGCDSETNSNSALIVDDVNTASSASTSATKTINGNGNNNYELSEFDAKTSTYR